MAVFIKKAFSKPKDQVVKSEAKTNEANQKTLKHFLGDYCQNFTSDIDELWDKCDADGNCLLDKEECRDFMNKMS